MLIRKIAKCGNSFGVIIPKAIREVLGWDEDVNLEYHPEGEALRLVPQAKTQAQHIDLLFGTTSESRKA